MFVTVHRNMAALVFLLDIFGTLSFYRCARGECFGFFCFLVRVYREVPPWCGSHGCRFIVGIVVIHIVFHLGVPILFQRDNAGNVTPHTEGIGARKVDTEKCLQ